MGQREEERKKKIVWKEQLYIDAYWNEKKRLGERVPGEKEYKKPLKDWKREDLGNIIW